MNSRKALVFILASVFLASTAYAQKPTKRTAPVASKRLNIEQDVDALGGNDAIAEMAQNIDPKNRARIVQKRIVDRDLRFELGLNYGGTFGGDPYLRTQNIGLNADLHITPRWSVGLRYTDNSNSLTPEGERVFDEFRNTPQGGRAIAPDVDPTLRSAYGVVNWYPVYGKMNLFDASVAQFDVYVIGGAGQIETDQAGWTPMFTGGLGLGLWVNKNWSIRTEFRALNYKDQIYSQENGSSIRRNITAGIATVGVGFLL